MDEHLSSDLTNEQLMFVLYGLGGSGKSEIMRRFVANAQLQTEGHSRRYSHPVSLCTFERETKFPLSILLSDSQKSCMSMPAR